MTAPAIPIGMRARLAEWRSTAIGDECLLRFGVGAETLQRIESGEIEPEPEIAARIHAFFTLPGQPLLHGGSPSFGGAAAHRGAAAFCGKEA